MRYSYVQPFVDAAQYILAEMLPDPVRPGEVRLASRSVASRGVVTIVGVTGEAEGRVLLDMAPETALGVAGAMNGASFAGLDQLGKDTLAELAGMIAGRAISILNDAGHQLKVSPPTLLVGDHLTISGSELEAMVVSLETSQGEVTVNVAIATC